MKNDKQSFSANKQSFSANKQSFSTNKLTQQKIQMWSEKLVKLEKEYESIMQQIGEAAGEGDLRENAAYQMLTEQGEVLSARIGETKKIIKDLGGDPEESKPASQTA